MAKFLKTTTLSFCLAVFGPEGAEANYSVSTKLGESAVYSEDIWWRGMFGSIQYKKLVERVGGSRIEYEPAFGLNDGINAVFKKINKHEERFDPDSYYTFGENGVKTEYIRISEGQNAFLITAEVSSSTEAGFIEFSNRDRSSFRDTAGDTVDSRQISDPTDVVHDSNVHGEVADVFDISKETRAIKPCKHIVGNIHQRDAHTFYQVNGGGSSVDTFSAIALLDGEFVFERRCQPGTDAVYEYDIPANGIDDRYYFSRSTDGKFKAEFERFGTAFHIGINQDTVYSIPHTYGTPVEAVMYKVTYAASRFQQTVSDTVYANSDDECVLVVNHTARISCLYLSSHGKQK